MRSWLLVLAVCGCATGTTRSPVDAGTDDATLDGAALADGGPDGGRDGAVDASAMTDGALTCQGPPDRDLEPNNGPPAATPVPAQASFVLSSIGICSDADVDYYTLNLRAADHLIVRIDFSHALGDLTLALLDESATVLRSSDSSSPVVPFETMEVMSAAAGKVYIKVAAKDPAVHNLYTLTVKVNP